MVTHGARNWVAQALDAVAAHTADGRYEIVIVDNASTDGTDDLVRERAATATAPMRVECRDENVGFAAGNDLAANLARGGVLCFLNSDALVPGGWLDALLTPLLDDPGIGATLPLFVGLDGRLQEAGTNVEPDGRVEAFGIRADADDVEWSWPRRVSYGSAACWMVRTATFRALGGFDAGYGIAYYEDVDFAFELARHGLRMELVPSVRVVHAQGASSPSSEVAVSRRDANQARFVARHAVRLAHRWHTLDLPNEPHRYVAARDVDVPRRVLVVADSLPAPDRFECDDRTRLTLALPATRLAGRADAAQALRTRGIEVVADPARVVQERLFQLDAIVAPEHWLTAHAEVLDEHQPQARRVAAEG
jgi:GT2 family glycosyltransferase